MLSAFSTLDYLIVIIYLVGTVALGSWFARGQASFEDYFLADRAAPWWAVGISIVATDLSAVSYMGAPAWVFEKDLRYGMGILLFPLIMLLVIYMFVPFMARLRLFTIYQYLEHRFGLSVRMFASILFLFLRGGWLATAIYTQSLALSLITPFSLVECIWLVGGVTGLYTVIGGMKAVLWTDVMQFFVLVGGIVVMVVAVLASFQGDIVEIWRLAAQNGHTRMFSFEFDLVTETTIWGLIASQLVITLNAYGCDQVVVQRYFTTSSRRDMARAVLFNGILVVPVMVLLYLLGVGFVAYYKTHPELMASLSSSQQVLPHFVVHALRGGLGGVVIAGLFAATMSSLSAGFNSLSTATMMDFYQRFWSKSEKLERKEVTAARWCTFAWVVGSSLAALLVDRLGTIVQITGKINGFFSGPLVGIFVLGVLTRRTNSFGALSGAILGTIATWLVCYTPVSWLWYGPAGFLITLVTGYFISYLRPAAAFDRVNPLTVWAKWPG